MTLINRRIFIGAMPVLALGGTAAGRSPRPIFAAIERRSGGLLGLSVIDTATRRTLAWRGDERFPFCSSVKGALAAFVLWKADRGQVDLSSPVRYGERDLRPTHR